MNRLTAGCKAPDFELPDQNGSAIRLDSLRGKKVLVYFYPKAMTLDVPPKHVNYVIAKVNWMPAMLSS